MKRTIQPTARLRSVVLRKSPEFDWEQYRQEWEEQADRALTLEEAKDDLRDRDADLKAMSARVTPLLTVSTVLLAAYGLQQHNGSISGWVARVGIVLTTAAIIVVLWSNMPSWKVWREKFEDAGKWTLGVKDEHDRFVRLTYKIHVRNAALTRVRRLHTISYTLVILSVLITAIAFIIR